MKLKKLIKTLIFLLMNILLSQLTFAQQNSNEYLNRFLLLRDKINNPINGYFSPEGLPYHSPETLICEAPDYGHETTSEAYSYWIWLEAMYGRIKGDWSPLNNAWTKMEKYAIPTNDLQPTSGDYKPNAPATYASEFGLPSFYPAALQSGVPVGKDPVSPELTSTYGNSNVYGMHWLFDLDNFYGFGNKGDGISKASYINTFQRGVQESVWETLPQPSWESFNWGSNDGSGFLKLFTFESNAPAKQWKYTNAPDADARVVQAMYWATQWAKDQGLNPATVLPLDKTKKMGDYLRLSMFDKYFKPIGVQNINGAGATGYDSAHYLLSWYYAWGGPLTAQGWAWRIGCSHNHFGYQNPVAAYALSAVPELKPLSPNASRDWTTSLTRQIELYQWLQSAEGAIAGGATNSWNGKYDQYPAGTPTFYNMAYVENPVYEDPGSNTWFGFQAWSMERVAEYYYLTNDTRAKGVLDKWIPWVKSVTHLLPNGSYEIPSTIGWSGKPNTWTPSAPVANTGLHVNVVSYTQDIGVSACLAKALTYYAAATKKHSTLDVASRDLAKAILDRMWNKYYEPNGKGVATDEARGDYKRFFDQEVYVPAGWTGKMPNGDIIKPGIKFIDIRSKYKSDPDFPALQTAYATGTDFIKKYHRFWAQTDVALANAEYGYFFETSSTTSWNITASAGTNGTISPSGVVSVPNGTNKTFTITANAGYQINDILVNGISVGAVATYTFTNVTSNQTITASFKIIETNSPIITATAGANGTISPSGVVSVTNGTNKTFTITANVGYQINDVLVNGTSVGALATYTFTNVITNQTISATFKTITTGGSCLLTRFNVPRASALPDSNSSYSKVYTLGQGAPNLSNVTNAVINWSLPNNGLWQLSFNTNNGVPNWWIDMRNSLQNFAQPKPAITFNGTGIANLDGNKYYVNYVDGNNTVFVEVTGKHAIYFSNSTTPPAGCSNIIAKAIQIKDTNIDDIVLYPNPATHFLKMNFPKSSGIKQITIYDISGRIILQKEIDSKSEEQLWDIHKISSGLYILTFESDEKTWTKSLLKK
jgi:Glycosyl hydrolase family 48/Secretion system C-terminal sorting domain/Divergent InlB B-repeat domain